MSQFILPFNDLNTTEFLLWTISFVMHGTINLRLVDNSPKWDGLDLFAKFNMHADAAVAAFPFGGRGDETWGRKLEAEFPQLFLPKTIASVAIFYAGTGRYDQPPISLAPKLSSSLPTPTRTHIPTRCPRVHGNTLS
jgi:hypothetical protein